LCEQIAQKAAAVKRRRTQVQQGGAVPGRAIPDMTLESVTHVALCQPHHQGVTGLFGQHAGGGDRQTMPITRHQGALPTRPQAQRQIAVDDQQAGLQGAALQGPQHCQFGGPANAYAVNLAGRGLAQGHTAGPVVDQRYQGLPPPG